MEEAVAEEGVKEVAEAAKDAVNMKAAEAATVAVEDEEIHAVNEVLVINIKGNRKALYIEGLVLIAHQNHSNIQG